MPFLSGRLIPIKSPQDFKKAFKDGRAVKAPNLILYIRENGLGVARLGVSIARASIKHATRRNRIKRVIREMWRQCLAEAIKGQDVVIVVKSHPKHSNEYIREELKNAFKKII